MKPKVLLLSGYDAASHQYWRETLDRGLGNYHWTQLALPARHFAWRTRGSSLDFAFNYSKELSQSFDLIVATSMVDLASLRGFIPALAKVPTILYFHENQFVYPVSHQQPNIINAQLTSIYSALCANFIVFNSQYNLKSFFKGISQLFKKLPDKISPELVKTIESRSRVLPVPIENDGQNTSELSCSISKNVSQRPIKIVWNHRWEYDKQPEVFFNAMQKLKEQGHLFRLHVLGQSFSRIPECFEKAKLKFNHEIDSWGFQPEQQYREILRSSDIVVSSALHDFQGLSMQQAISYGCVPLAPNRVAYPEYIPPQNLYSVADNLELEALNLAENLQELIQSNKPLVPDISSYYAENLLPEYDTLFSAAINAR